MSGFVYAIRSGGYVKIGWSADPQQRLSKISTDTPSSCELVGAILASKEFEAELHSRFSPWKQRGEWFREDGDVAGFEIHNHIRRQSVWALVEKAAGLAAGRFNLSKRSAA